MSTIDGANSRAITGGQVIVSGKGVVYGFVVSSHTSGTLKLWDNTEASGDVLMDTFTFPSGSGVYEFPAPLNFHTGLYADLSADEKVVIVFNQA